jgi:hypothetical protein
VWRAIVTTSQAGIAPDALAVKALLVKTGQFEHVTPSAYLRMVDAIPRGIDLVGRAQHVLTAARYRRIQAECWEFCRMATLMAETPDVILSHIAARCQWADVAPSDTGLKVFEGITTPINVQMTIATGKLMVDSST